MSTIKEHDKEHIVGTYARFDVEMVRGNGSTCYDEDGNSYIDFTSGIGVNSLGFCDPDWVEAVSSQAKTLQHISNLYYTEPCVKLADLLVEKTGYAKVFFGNSGAEANEGAIKVARKYSFDRYGKERQSIVTLVNSFHGRTVTTLSATGQDVFHQYFFPFTGGFSYAKANDINDLKSKLDDSVCAVMFEPVQGEGGVVPLDPDFVCQMEKICKQRDILLIADEVQTGVGRTGKFLAGEYFGIKPDLTTLAKGLGGGLPIGAVLCSEKTADVLKAGDHGSTFGGNPVSCAGGLVCVKKIAEESFLNEVNQKADLIKRELRNVDEIEDITGLGLMLGLKLKQKSAKQVAGDCLKNGLLVLTAKEKVRLLPPLTISDEELKKGLFVLKAVLES